MGVRGLWTPAGSRAESQLGVMPRALLERQRGGGQGSRVSLVDRAGHAGRAAWISRADRAGLDHADLDDDAGLGVMRT